MRGKGGEQVLIGELGTTVLDDGLDSQPPAHLGDSRPGRVPTEVDGQGDDIGPAIGDEAPQEDRAVQPPAVEA